MKYEAIVIGGGISGMTSALILSKRGMSVALVEQHRQLAPILRGFSRNGISFDTGLHYTGGLGPNGPLLRYLRHLDLSDITITPYPDGGFDEFHFLDTGQTFVQPSGRHRLELALNETFPGNEAALNTYFAEIEREWDESSYLNLERPFPKEPFTLVRDERTLLDFLNSLTNDQSLKAVLSAHTILYGVPPQRALFRTHAQVAGSYIHSAHTIKGGGNALVDAYQKQLNAYGVDVLCGQAVMKLTLNDSGDVAGVELTDGSTIEAALCVFTTHPSSMVDMLPETVLRAGYRKRIRSLNNCHSAYMAFGKMHEVPAPLHSRNLLQFCSSDPQTMYPDPDALADSPLFISRAGDDNGVVIKIAASDALKPEWTADAGGRTEAYHRYKASMQQQFLDRLHENCPDIAKRLDILEFATPLTLSDYGHLPAGSIYGAEHAAGQYPVFPRTKLKGLLLAGQSVIAPGIMGAVISAYVACGMVIGQETLRKEVVACS